MILHIHCDGSCYAKDGRMGMGVAFFYESRSTPFHKIRLSGKHLGTSNEAEYLAIKEAVRKLLTLQKNITGAIIYSDSMLVIRQLQGRYKIREPRLYELNSEIKLLLQHMIDKPVDFTWVPREHPRQRIVDRLSKEANPYFFKEIK